MAILHTNGQYISQSVLWRQYSCEYYIWHYMLLLLSRNVLTAREHLPENFVLADIEGDAGRRGPSSAVRYQGTTGTAGGGQDLVHRRYLQSRAAPIHAASQRSCIHFLRLTLTLAIILTLNLTLTLLTLHTASRVAIRLAVCIDTHNYLPGEPKNQTVFKTV